MVVFVPVLFIADTFAVVIVIVDQILLGRFPFHHRRKTITVISTEEVGTVPLVRARRHKRMARIAPASPAFAFHYLKNFCVKNILIVLAMLLTTDNGDRYRRQQTPHLRVTLV